jgi:ribosomal protein S21
MIIVPLKEGENIERALKKFKRKFEKTVVILLQFREFLINELLQHWIY